MKTKIVVILASLLILSGCERIAWSKASNKWKAYCEEKHPYETDYLHSTQVFRQNCYEESMDTYESLGPFEITERSYPG